MDRVADLRADYEQLGKLLAIEDDGSKASALARERRMIGELLELMEAPKGATVVDQLASRRARAGVTDAPSRRRKSG